MSDLPIPSLFQGFRDELDAFNDRRERLIKVLSILVLPTTLYSRAS